MRERRYDETIKQEDENYTMEHAHRSIRAEAGQPGDHSHETTMATTRFRPHNTG